MQDQFESRKNFKAGTYTALILGALIVLLLFVRWTLPALPPAPVDEGIEVNLGNSDFGQGHDQPFNPGQPAPSHEQAYVPPKPTVSEPEPVKDVNTDDKATDAPEIKKPTVVKPEAKKISEKEVVKTTPKKVEQPVTNPAPPVPRPKAQMKGVTGTGTGGNDADSYKQGGNEGIAGGKGDQGRPGGDPDSKNYTGGGGHGKSPITISRGLQGRYFLKTPTFQDDFNENAVVAVDIKVDGNGNVTNATYQPRGSSTAEADYKDKAIRSAYQLKLNPTGQESSGTISFNFKLHN
jgi:hypothetical protein